jgi:hypothetical protein
MESYSNIPCIYLSETYQISLKSDQWLLNNKQTQKQSDRKTNLLFTVLIYLRYVDYNYFFIKSLLILSDYIFNFLEVSLNLI